MKLPDLAVLNHKRSKASKIFLDFPFHRLRARIVRPSPCCNSDALFAPESQSFLSSASAPNSGSAARATSWSFREVTEHEAWFREDTEVIDFFAPPRDDFLIGGKPAYMSEG